MQHTKQQKKDIQKPADKAVKKAVKRMSEINKDCATKIMKM